jgi:hypothetical protein
LLLSERYREKKRLHQQKSDESPGEGTAHRADSTTKDYGLKFRSEFNLQVALLPKQQAKA